jgi:putative Mn2+ efflux pump MntP
MDIITILFIAMGLSMDAVAVAIGLKILLEHLGGG